MKYKIDNPAVWIYIPSLIDFLLVIDADDKTKLDCVSNFDFYLRRNQFDYRLALLETIYNYLGDIVAPPSTLEAVQEYIDKYRRVY